MILWHPLTTKKAYDGHIWLQIFRRNARDLQTLLADKIYSWAYLREACRGASVRLIIKDCEQKLSRRLKTARINEDVYNLRSMNETGLYRIRQFLSSSGVYCLFDAVDASLDRYLAELAEQVMQT